jgi:hypothetical protein
MQARAVNKNQRFKKEMEPNTAFGKASSSLPEFSSYHMTKTSRLIS